MTSLGVHLRLLKNPNLRHVSGKILGITYDFSFSKTRNCDTSQHTTPHALGLWFRARGFRSGTGFGAWGLRFRLAGFRDYRVQGLG